MKLNLSRRFQMTQDDVLDQFAAGRMTIPEILARYPEQAEELGPLLRAAGRARALPWPVLARQTYIRIQRKMLSHAQQSKRRPALRRMLESACRTPRWATGALSLILALTVLGTGMAAAAGSLPGEPLYTAKDAFERAEVLIAPSGSQPGTYLSLAQRRLQEIETLSALGITDGLAPRTLAEQTELAIHSANALPRGQRAKALNEIARFLEQEQVVLRGLKYEAPEAQRGSLTWALEAAETSYRQIIQELGESALP